MKTQATWIKALKKAVWEDLSSLREVAKGIKSGKYQNKFRNPKDKNVNQRSK